MRMPTSLRAARDRQSRRRGTCSSGRAHRCTVCSGEMVTGSTIMPLSERFTRSTSSAWRSMVMLRCTKPRPPCRAMAMARRDSVTVSMAAETMGMFSEILRVRQVRVSASVGRMEDLPGKQQHVVKRQALDDAIFNSHRATPGPKNVAARQRDGGPEIRSRQSVMIEKSIVGGGDRIGQGRLDRTAG